MRHALPPLLKITLLLALGCAFVLAQTTNYTDDNPALSPDGKKIVFMSDGDGDIEIYVMDVDGSHERRLTNVAPGINATDAVSNVVILSIIGVSIMIAGLRCHQTFHFGITRYQRPMNA